MSAFVADLQSPLGVGPAHQHRQVAADGRFNGRHLAEHDIAGRAVDGDEIPDAEGIFGNVDFALGVVDLQRRATGDTRLAHAARDDRRVRGHAAARGQHPLRRDHAMKILRACLDPHEDDRFARLTARLRLIGIEDDLARRRAG